VLADAAFDVGEAALCRRDAVLVSADEPIAVRVVHGPALGRDQCGEGSGVTLAGVLLLVARHADTAARWTKLGLVLSRRAQ
jgi:hypothetical protein